MQRKTKHITQSTIKVLKSPKKSVILKTIGKHR